MQPETRRVSNEMCRALMQQPSLTDEQAEQILNHLYLVANVVVDAFIDYKRPTRKHDPSDVQLDNEQPPSVAQRT
jgi:hypothetical protein